MRCGEGTFVADAGVTRPLPGNLGVTARSLWGSESMMRFGGGNTFRLAGLNGIATIGVEGLPEEWTVKSILVNGVDMTASSADASAATNSSWKTRRRLVFERGSKTARSRRPG